MSPEARASALFAGLQGVELQDVAALARVVELADGDTLFHEGDDGDALYVVDKGRVRIVKRRADEEERTLATLVAGDVIGEMALLVEGERTATVVADGPCRLHRIGRSGFLELLESREPVAFEVLLGLARLLCARLARVNEVLAKAAGTSGETPTEGWVSLDRLRRALADPSTSSR